MEQFHKNIKLVQELAAKRYQEIILSSFKPLRSLSFENQVKESNKLSRQ